MRLLSRVLPVALGFALASGGGAVVLLRGGSAGGSNIAGSRPSVTAVSGNGQGGERGAHANAPLSPALAALRAELDGVLAGTNSCLSVQDATGQVLYQHQPTTSLIPASTQKLVVAEAALATLGPDFRFTTTVVAPAAPVNGQVAALWLVGDGDPLLATPEFMAAAAGRVRMAGYPWTPLSALADQLAAAGVKLVAGGIRGDDTAQDPLRYLPVWPASYQQQSQIGALSALNVNEGAKFGTPKSTIAPDPPAYAAGELARLLIAKKVAVGSAPDQAAPAGTVALASVSSAPMSQIVEVMLRASDDWVAELLVRAIDTKLGGKGSTAGGVADIMAVAARSGLPMDGVQMDDGSGLSRTDRATCRELLASLDLGDHPGYGPILAGLPVAAQSGTLVARYHRTPLAGVLRAKTGNLDGVAGLVGEVDGPSVVRFAFLDNDQVSLAVLFQREDAVAGALFAYATAAGPNGSSGSSG